MQAMLCIRIGALYGWLLNCQGQLLVHQSGAHKAAGGAGRVTNACI
jgi:hypothetical protein